MEITDDAVPTITRPMTQSRATSTSRSVETATCRPAICTFPLGAGAGVRAGAVERLGGAAAVRAGVISSGLPRPARRGRAHLPRPTPVASTSLPHRAAEVADQGTVDASTKTAHRALTRHVNFATVRKS